MSVAVAPRVILRRNTPRAAGIWASSASVLPSTSLLLTRTSTPSTGTASSSLSSTSVAFAPSDVHQHIARAGDGDDIAFAQHGVGRRFLDLSVAADAQNEDARVGHQPLGLDDAQADGLSARCNAVGPHCPTLPGRARAADFLAAAALLLLVVLARGFEIDAEQLRAEDGNDDRRADGTEHVGHGIGDRHRVEQGLGLRRVPCRGG